ncbi:NUDIX hydrolase [Deinococcus aluminii]|uniref:Nudix hydrolase domain-containing protein n=1 Tax=Deinococcus aluminii TaxID=1656885 RepID=A0ABP9X8M3_9DEIO
MTDVRLPIGDSIFCVRAVILCLRDGYLLVNTEKDVDFLYLPGGAITVDEATPGGAAREWTEETGLPAGPLRLVGVVENFFTLSGRRWHELGFYYQMDAPAELPRTPFTVKDNPNVTCIWLPLSEVRERHVVPLPVRDLLDVPADTVRHIVNRE